MIGQSNKHMVQRKREGLFVPRAKKPVASKMIEDLVDSFEVRPGHCRFITHDNGKHCCETAVNCHVLPRVKVLNEMLSDKSGKVMELQKRPEQVGHMYMRSNPQNTLDFSNQTLYEPYPIGTDKACSGYFACLRHDQQFNGIDSADIDFENPMQYFLAGYRAVLYETFLCRQGKSFVRHWNTKISRHPDMMERVNWHRRSRQLEKGSRKAYALSDRLGQSWHQFECSKRFVSPVTKHELFIFVPP